MSNNPFKKKPTPKQCVEVGGFIVKMYFKEDSIVDSYMEIRTVSDNWSMRLDARHKLYGYLYAAIEQDKKEQIHGYCATMYILATAMYLDQQLVNEVKEAIDGFIDRRDKVAKEEAEKVTDAQIAGDEALMHEAIERGKLRGNKKAEKKASKESKKLIKEIIEEEENERKD